MEQTKIQNLTPQGSFESNGKTFYKFDCILENGQIGEVNALSPDKWSVGDEVVVKEHQATKWGPRLKLDKPGFSGGFTGKSGGNDDTTKGIIASWAVGCAMASRLETYGRPGLRPARPAPAHGIALHGS